MAQRPSRAKARIKQTGGCFVVPVPEQLPQRVDAVLDAIYTAYARGWGVLREAAASALASEALWLAQLVVHLLPDDPEAKGLLALMLHSEARRRAWRDSRGRYVPLEAQAIEDWDRSQIAAAEALLTAANHGGRSGRFQLEAAIQSAHVARRLTGANTWLTVVALYDHLFRLTVLRS